ncbi:MAG: hypothetical protein JWR85_3988 [Marmoricola sp.]|nr:hypothetical protein [Marmoricola sp.]
MKKVFGLLSTARRTKRSAGVVGVLAATALAASGCMASPVQNSGPIRPDPQVTAMPKIADFPEAYKTANVQDGFVEQFGPGSDVAVANAGLKIMEVLVEDHPQYTLAAWKPTVVMWTKDIAPKFKPLVSSRE